MIEVIDEWRVDGDTFRAANLGGGMWAAQRWSSVADKWVDAGIGDVVARLNARCQVNNVEARRISFLAAALMRCLQLADILLDDAPAGFAKLAGRHLAALKGVALACGLPLKKWEVPLEGVEEDPETAEARRRLGLDVKTQVQRGGDPAP